MPKPIDSRNCVLYSNLYPINKDPLLPIVKAHNLTIVDIIEEDPKLYKRVCKQPKLTKLFGDLELEVAKYIVVESLNHLFTVNAYEVLRYFKVFKDLGVRILTPDGEITYANCSDAVLTYHEQRDNMLRTLAARAGIARGGHMGRPKVIVNVDELARCVVRNQGNLSEAAREMNLCHVTALRRLREAGYDLDKLHEGEIVIISQEEIRQKAAMKAVAREEARQRKIAKAAKMLEIKEK